MKKILKVMGIGPIYVSLITIITIISYFSTSKCYKISSNILYSFLILIAVALVIVGIILWVAANFKSKLSKNVISGKLITDGVYSYCRNPIYTAFMFFNWAAILIIARPILFLLMPIYWIIMTILIKNTEEKWLQKEFKDEFINYKLRVNRVFPFKK